MEFMCVGKLLRGRGKPKVCKFFCSRYFIKPSFLLGVTEEEGIPDAEDEEVIEKEEDIIQETLFTFDAFEMVGIDTKSGCFMNAQRTSLF